MNNKYMIIVGIGLSNLGICPAHTGAQDLIVKMTRHIIHREKVAFMRFDKRAMEIMERSDNVGQEMKYIYTSAFPGVYKASLRRDEHAGHTFDPLFMLAREDLNHCTRFLKLLKEHTALVVCETPFPEDMARTLFRKGCIQVCVENAGIETVDALTACCDQILADVEGFSIVVTSLSGIAPLVQYRLLQKRNNILLFDLDALAGVLLNPMQTLIDRPRFDYLMSRNITCLCTGNLTEVNYQQQKEHYIQRVHSLNHFGYEPHIVEAGARYPTFLDAEFNHVQYIHTDAHAIQDYDLQEANALIAFIASQKVDLRENDILVSFPEAYCFQDDQVLRLLEEDIAPDILARKGFKEVADVPCRVYQYMRSIN